MPGANWLLAMVAFGAHRPGTGGLSLLRLVADASMARAFTFYIFCIRFAQHPHQGARVFVFSITCNSLPHAIQTKEQVLP